MIIAIDGPAGAGKSTTARAVAEHFGFAYIDTGAMYRAVALAASEKGLRLGQDDLQIVELARVLPLRFEENGKKLFIGARDVSGEIRAPQIGAQTSAIAAIAELREIIVEMQRCLAREGETIYGGAVLEGRDIQTVVFPDAPVKVFLTADENTRAVRRAAQLAAKGDSPNADAPNENAPNADAHSANAQRESDGHQNAARDIRERDERDSTRAVSPLCAAPDAVHIATDDLSLEQVVAGIAQIIESQRAAGQIERGAKS